MLKNEPYWDFTKGDGEDPNEAIMRKFVNPCVWLEVRAQTMWGGHNWANEDT